MTPQERELLSSFLTQLTQAQVQNKNAEAAALITQACKQQPDADYLLVQRAMLMSQALETLKVQNQQLQNQLASQTLPAQRDNGNFLNNDPWAQQPPPVYSRQPAQQPAGNGFANPFAAAPAGGGVSSFLGSVATTAVGVAAGSFLFQGIENLLGHHGSGAGSAWPGSGHNGYVPEQTTINNYYMDQPPSDPTYDSSSYDDTPDFTDAAADADYDQGSDDSSWI